ICPDGPADLAGVIGRAVLATLLPARRLRFSARKVKCATARYLNRDDGRPPHPAAITATGITISTPPLDLKPRRTRRARTTPAAPAHLAGGIGRPGRPRLRPARRLRSSARKVKCATARSLNRDDGRPPHPAAITATGITISTPPLDLKPGRTRRDRTTPAPP